MVTYEYNTASWESCVGLIDDLRVVPYYQFTVEIEDKNIWCHLEHVLTDWHIHLIELGESVRLSFPLDIKDNVDKLSIILDEKDAVDLAYAIRSVYEETSI